MQINWQVLEENLAEAGWEIIYRYETEGYSDMTEQQTGYNDIQAAYAVVKTHQITDGLDSLLIYGYIPRRDVWYHAVKAGPLVYHLLKMGLHDNSSEKANSSGGAL